MQSRFLIAILAVMLSIAAGTAWAEGPLTKDQAEEAAGIVEAWLKLIDQGKYKESWDQAGVMLPQMIEQGKWVELMQKVRKPLGEVESRKLFVVEKQMNPPRSPRGEWLRLKFNTSFSNRKTNIEIVSMYKEKDGKFKTAVYFVHPDSSGVGMD